MILDLIKRKLPPSGPTVKVTGVLLDELKDLAPGQVLRLSGRDGRHYAIMDWEDFEHIGERAGVTTRGESQPSGNAE